MSLLLEALKKAELAKQNAMPAEPASRPEEAASRAPMPELRLADPAQPVITRESLPDIGQSLEIMPDDFASPKPAQQAAAARASAAVPPPDIESPADAPPAAIGASRDAARQMFDVKEVEYNPRRPFYITIGVLVAFGLGYGTYVWWQMQPHYAINTAAVKDAPKAPLASAAPTAAAQAPASEQDRLADAAKAAAPARVASNEQAPSRATRAPSADTSAAAEPAPAPRAQPALLRPTPRAPDTLPITVTPASPQTDPVLQSAFTEYQNGQLDAAREQYQRLLERDPTNRDALLGLAAIDVRTRNFETAELRYIRLLELNPRDTRAHAGLIALQGNVDPVQSESRIKNLIAAQPEATHLYFTLGNQYAAQGRWPEAQDAYFRAYSAEPDNPDYTYNLAVSLDQLRQRRLALEHYRKAIALAASRPAAFDVARARARAAELER